MTELSPLTLLAPAKVNLFLEVLHRRDDGFHEIDSIMASINLCDRIDFIPTENPEIALESNDPNLPLDRTNLIVQAAELFFEQTGIQSGISLKLEKRIPMGSGLGGGSSDATTTLLGLNRLFQTDLPPSTLEPWAAKIGSDCPFFVRGPDSGWARIRGRGEQVETLPFPSRPLSLILVLPPFPVATPEIYRHSNELLAGPRITCEKLIDQLQASTESLGPIDPTLFNRLSSTARTQHPDLDRCLRNIAETVPCPIHLTGSGSAAFLIFQSPTPPDEIVAKLRETFPELRVLSCRFQPRSRSQS